MVVDPNKPAPRQRPNNQQPSFTRENIFKENMALLMGRNGIKAVYSMGLELVNTILYDRTIDMTYRSDILFLILIHEQ